MLPCLKIMPNQLYLSAYDPEHHVYPVKIISIDDWTVTDDIKQTDYRLAEGEHKIRLIPDFSNIEPQLVFMNSIWQEKLVRFKILNQQKLAVTARLLDRNKLLWDVQLYSIELPTEEDIK